MIRARQLVRTSVGYGAVMGWLAFLGLFTTPYLIHRLGTSRYGIFALINILAAYLSNLEFGFGQATVRFLARARAADNADEERRVVNTSFAVFLGASLAAATLAFVGAPLVTRLFVHPASLRPEALDAIRISSVILFASICSSFASGSLQALARFHVVLRTRLIFGTLASIAAVVAAASGGGLRTVLIAQAVVACTLMSILLIELSRSTRSPLRPRVQLQTLRMMAAFGAFVLLGGLAYQLMLQAPPTVLAGYATTAQVAAYAVPSIIFQNLAVLAGSASLAFFPFVSAEGVKRDRRHLSEVYRANLRVTLLFIGPVVAFLIVFAHPLLKAWIGGPFAARASAPLQFLSGAALVIALSSAPADTARGLGRPDWVATYTACTAAITIAASFAVTPGHGAAGAAFALLFGLAVVTVPFVALVASRLLHLRSSDLRRALLRPALALSLIAVFDVAGAAISQSFLAAVVVGAIGSVAYAVLAFTCVLDERERKAVGQIFRRRADSASGPPAGAQTMVDTAQLVTEPARNER